MDINIVDETTPSHIEDH